MWFVNNGEKVVHGNGGKIFFRISLKNFKKPIDK